MDERWNNRLEIVQVAELSLAFNREGSEMVFRFKSEDGPIRVLAKAGSKSVRAGQRAPENEFQDDEEMIPLEFGLSRRER